MKVLFNCNLPFCLAHGGQAIQVHQTMTALRRIGVEAEPLRWWDESQTGDVLQFFGRMPTEKLQHVAGLAFIPPAQWLGLDADPSQGSHGLMHLYCLSAVGETKRQIAIE